MLPQLLSNEGPYPLLVEPPDPGYWIQNGNYESAKGEDGVWRAPEISTEHFRINTDKTAFVYGKHFVGRVSAVLRYVYGVWFLPVYQLLCASTSLQPSLVI